MQRREMLTGALVAPVVFALPASSDSGLTPVMKLFREWEAAAEAEDRAADNAFTDDECDALSAARRSVEERLMAEPCLAAQDFICKVIAYSSYGVFGLQTEREAPQLWAEARALVA